MEKKRCDWAGDLPIYVDYHDHEWGVPVIEDRRQFEFLVLESAQAGLSWLTILKKRENYRAAYAGFDPVVVAGYGEKEIAGLKENPGIVRNRLKIEASVNNAARFIEVQREFGSFCRYIWQFTDFKVVRNQWKALEQLPAKTALSDEITADLKKRGFRFLGSTIVYAHMQATGLVNDHLVDCFRYKKVSSVVSAKAIAGLSRDS